MFYVESWLFVHYPFDTRQVTKAGQYFTLTNNHRVPVPEAVQTAFGMSVNQLNGALTKYFKKGKIQIIRYKLFPYRVRLNLQDNSDRPSPVGLFTFYTHYPRFTLPNRTKIDSSC